MKAASAAILLVVPCAAFCGTVTQGPPVQAADLAHLLNVFTTSLIYKEDHPFTSVRFSLVYRERKQDGTWFTRSELADFTSPYGSPEATEVPVTVLVDKTRSLVISGPYSSYGRGVDVGEFFTTETPPPLGKDGAYVLLRTKIDPDKTDTDANTKGILELKIITSK